jgi:hypothetical protein
VARVAVGNDLGGDVVGRATNGLFALFGVNEESSEAKVADFDLHLVREEEVAELQVAVDNVRLVEGKDDVDDLEEVALRLRLGEILAALFK